MPKISLAAARVNANLTQEQVANELKVNKKTIVNWEKGYTSLSAVDFKKLTELYNMPGDYIFLPINPLKAD